MYSKRNSEGSKAVRSRDTLTPVVMTMNVEHTQTARCADLALLMREMTQDDVEPVVGIELQSFSDPWSRTLFHQQLKTEWGLNYVAVLQEQSLENICGYVCGMIVHNECTLHKIACDPGYRRRGIAGELMGYFITQALSRGATSFFLEVRASNSAAQELYKKFGFIETSIRRRYYSESGEDALIMELHSGICLKQQEEHRA